MPYGNCFSSIFYSEKGTTICINIIHLSAGVASCAAQRKELNAKMRDTFPTEAVQSMRKQDKIKLSVLRVSPLAYEWMMQIYDKK